MKNFFSAVLCGIMAVMAISCDKDNDIHVASVSLNKPTVGMFVGGSVQLIATVTPEDATDKTVTWSTSDASVATVEDGMVSAIKEGTATITATAGTKTADCQVTVAGGTIQLTLSSTDAAILHAAGGKSPAIVSASGNWSATSDSEWLSVSPSSGSAGDTELQITTTQNGSTDGRTAVVFLTMNGATQSFEILQRGNVFTKTTAASGKVTNGVKLTYSGSKFTRIYAVLPRPETNQYQAISSLSAPGCNETDCPDGVNSYIWKDVQSSDIPASGEFVISESFDATVYRITTDFTKMKDIPAYDAQSEECKKYLGKENNGLIDPTHSKIASTANTLWLEACKDIITYARKCHEWTYANITYGNMNTGLHTIANLMQTMKGDCGNYSSVFISLLRAKGIPARHVVMVHGSLDEFHVRAEFYVPAYGWIPADPTWGDNYFGVFEGKYIVVSQGINNIIRDCDGKDFQADLLQTYCCWYWYQTAGSFSLSHSCTGLN